MDGEDNEDDVELDSTGVDSTGRCLLFWDVSVTDVAIFVDNMGVMGCGMNVLIKVKSIDDNEVGNTFAETGNDDCVGVVSLGDD